MPEPQHPPYGIGALQPRTLVRWLDVNPQNGPLSRARYYIRIPAFAPMITQGAYDYYGVRKFSIKDLSGIPFGLGYAVCLVFQDKYGNVSRYTLNPDTVNIPWSIPMYNGQPIPPNFRIEIYPSYILSSTGPFQPINQQNDFLMLTSVMLGQDYRYADDSELIAPNPIFTSFYSTNGLNLPLTFNPASALPTNN